MRKEPQTGWNISGILNVIKRGIISWMPVIMHCYGVLLQSYILFTHIQALLTPPIPGDIITLKFMISRKASLEFIEQTKLGYFKEAA
jgi:hypothetical protein